MPFSHHKSHAIIDRRTIDTCSKRTANRSFPAIGTMLFGLAASALLAGCSRSGPPRVPTHVAKGSISYQGQPIAGAFLVLHPKEGVRPDVPTARAQVSPDGTFAVSTYDQADGAPAGEYVVTVEWKKPVKVNGDYVLSQNLLPAKYSSRATSDLVVSIAAGKNDLPPLALRR
jgi:hypothetical protein